MWLNYQQDHQTNIPDYFPFNHEATLYTLLLNVLISSAFGIIFWLVTCH
jgi:hypothetical protein